MSEEEKGVDYYKQQAEQNQANLRKTMEKYETVQATAERVASEKESLAQELAGMKTKLSQIEEQKNNASQYKPLDTDLVDPNVAANLTVLQKQLADLSKNYQELKGKASQFEKIELDREANKLKEDLIDAICDPLDKEFGAKYRNQARENVNKAIEAGELQRPEGHIGAVKAQNFLRAEYAKLSKEKTSDVTDKGGGNVVLPAKEPIKEGTRAEVKQQMLDRIRKKKK